MYYLALIILMKYVIPTPTYPAISTPQGSSSLLTFPILKWKSNDTMRVGVSPDDNETIDFMNLVLKNTTIFEVCIIQIKTRLEILSRPKAPQRLKKNTLISY